MLMIITYGALLLSTAISSYVLIRVAIASRTFTRDTTPQEYDKTHLPTVSVCIPARNESNAMTQCLERVIASDYPKLEIIVFDDQSGDNTSFLIKSFAHAGVRFIQGDPLPEGWLGKNFAEHSLFHEASGDYLVYLDVDTHIAPSTITTLVAQATSRNLAMISVLPSRNDSVRASVLFATLRYFWVLVLHRANRPAVASSLWLISRAYLDEDTNGFEAIKDVIEPEVRIAAELMQANAYQFYFNDKQLGVSYEKKWRSQCETAIRLLFRFVGGTNVGLIAAILALLLLLYPAYVLITSIITVHWSYDTTLALIATVLLASSYIPYLSSTWARGRVLGVILLPIAIVQELVLLIISAYRYKTGTVTWKGRPVHASARVSRVR